MAAAYPVQYKAIQGRISYEPAERVLISMLADPVDRRRQTLALTHKGADLLRRGCWSPCNDGDS